MSVSNPSEEHFFASASSSISIGKQEPCFAFIDHGDNAGICAIASVKLDLASTDYFRGQATAWISFDMVSEDGVRATLLGSDLFFLNCFARQFLLAATTYQEHILILTGYKNLAEYVTSRNAGAAEKLPPPRQIIFRPYSGGVLILALWQKDGKDGEREALFQLPRANAFLRDFARMISGARRAVEATLEDMRRTARISSAP